MRSTSRAEVPLVGSEQEILLAWLDFHRDTLRQKTEGLDAEQLRRRLGPSTLTLGGLLKHLALVEDSWFTRGWGHQPLPEPWASADWGADPDWDFTSAAEDSPERLRAQFEESVARSRSVVAAQPDLGVVVGRRRSGGTQEYSCRWILTHMVEEYARHNGHADLLRESIDGEVGA